LHGKFTRDFFFYHQYSKMIQNPSYSELQKAANQGRRCTWEKLSAIRANCAIELALDECVVLLNHMRRLKRSAERATASQGHGPTIRLCPSRRIPSWNLIARENSTGSLEEEILISPTPANHQGSNRHHFFQRNAHDSDSESESIDLNSWTRSGGPLMRTTSANKFISFVQNLEIETEFRTVPSRDDGTNVVTPNTGTLVAHAFSREASDRSLDNSGYSHDTVAPRSPFGPSTSIVVSEGDFLQPEKTENGILFNIVRRDTFLASSSGAESLGSSREADVETVHTDLGAVSASDDEDMEINVVDDDMGSIHRKDIQDQVSSSFHCENETNTNKPEANTNKPEAASMFDICTNINLSSMDSENTLPKESSAKREIETAKIECPDNKFSARKDEVCSGATD
jgi:TAG lipase / steryl ester hydrolase / phospholipase A2 / LPA acyltransferase